MPRIKMLENDRGCPDGFTIKTYEKGETYSVNASLAKAFCEDRKTAQPVGSKKPKPKPKPKPKAKATKAAPENKALAGADENKAEG